MAVIRLPRFTRASEVRPFRLTGRDLEIIRQINRHRFLRSSHLCRLLEGSPQQTLRRLQLLYHHGYLERPRAQLDYFHRGGSEPIIYGLGNKGAELLIRESAGTSQVLNWSWKNQSIGRVFLEHATLVSDILVALELSCRETGHQLLHADQIIPASKAPRSCLQWRVTLPGGRKVGVVPDALFVLEPNGAADPTSHSCFLLEADRGTMPIQRDSLSQTSFFRKLLAYHATWKQGLHRTQLGLPRFRVLTVTTNPDRLQSMVGACRQLPGGHGMFLFAQSRELQQSDPFTIDWVDGRAEHMRLLT